MWIRLLKEMVRGKMSERIQINDLIIELGDPCPRFIRIRMNDVSICFYGELELSLLISTLQQYQKIIEGEA